MKQSVLFCLVLVAFAGTTFPTNPVSISERNVLSIFQGVLDGLVIDVEVSQIQNCISDVQGVATEIESAVQDFQRKNPDSVKQGLGEIGKALLILPNAIQQCTSGYTAEVEKLQSVLKTFSNPITFAWTIGKSLLVNGRQIFSEVDDSIKQWQRQQYYNFGQDIGEALGNLVTN